MGGKYGLFAQALLVAHKDVLLEWRTRARLNALLFFSLATLLLFSFALGPDTALMRRHAGGYFWLGILFSSVLALGESFRVERDNRALDSLLLAPIEPRAVFLGKALSNVAVLMLLGGMITPIMIALYDVGTTFAGLCKFASILLLGTGAISSTGTLLAAISVNAKAKDVLLPLLLFPLLVPVLLASVKGATLALSGDPMGDMAAWTGLLSAFNVVYWALGFVLFPAVVEE